MMKWLSSDTFNIHFRVRISVGSLFRCRKVRRRQRVSPISDLIAVKPKAGGLQVQVLSWINADVAELRSSARLKIWSRSVRFRQSAQNVLVCKRSKQVISKITLLLVRGFESDLSRKLEEKLAVRNGQSYSVSKTLKSVRTRCVSWILTAAAVLF